MMPVADLIKGRPGATLLGLGILAAASQIALPSLRKRWASALKSGTKLFLEAEIEAHNAMVDRLVDTTVDRLLYMTARGSEDERKAAAEGIVCQFKESARARAQRSGWDVRDAEMRYYRGVRELRRRISEVASGAHDLVAAHAAALLHAAGCCDDYPFQEQGAPRLR
jgi:predicted exporter